MLFTILGLRFREVPYINSLTLLTPLHLYYLIFSSTNKLFSSLFVDVAKHTVSEPLKSLCHCLLFTLSLIVNFVYVITIYVTFSPRNSDLVPRYRFMWFSKTGSDTRMGNLASWDLLDFYMVSLLVHFKRHKTNPDKQTQKIFSCQISSTKIIEGIQYHHSELGPAVVKNCNNMILLRRNRAAEVVAYEACWCML